jgi:hypothetical protein
MTINVTGPDGSNIAFPDGTPENEITSALDAHYGAPAHPAAAGFDRTDPRFSGGAMAGEKFLEGVPVLGGLVPHAGAAISAVAHPLTGVGAPGETVAERYRANLAAEKAASAEADTEHPVLSTGLKIGGGVASFGGALKAVPKLAGPLGFEGTIPQMITKGAVSGAGLSAADAAVRGQDPGTAAVEGGILGSVAGPIGRGIGKVAGAVMRSGRGAAPLEHAVTTPVAGVDVPVPSMDPAVQSQIEIARKGAAGVPAQQVVQTGDVARDAAIEKAKGNIGAGLDPNATGVPPPQDSAETVAAELRAQEANRFQTEQATTARAVQGTQELRQSLDTTVAPPEVIQAAHDDFAKFGAKNAFVPQKAQQISDKFGPRAAEGYTTEYDRLIEASRQAQGNVSQEAMQPVRGAPPSPEAAVLPGVPRGPDAGVAPGTSVDPGAEIQGLGAELRGGLPAAGQIESAALSDMRGTGQPNAPSGLPAAPAGGMDVPPLSSGLAREAAPLGSPPASAAAPPNPATVPAIHAESPLAAGEVLSAGIQRKAEEAAAKRTAAYEAKAQIPGEYDPRSLRGSGNAIRNQLSSGPIEDRVSVNSTTPNSSAALQLIDETIGGKPPAVLPNEATPFTAIRGEGGKFESGQVPEPITGQTMEGVRKALNRLYSNANRAANSPGGSAEDLRGMKRIIDAFDTHISTVEDAGGFSGDADALAKARLAARAAHADYKQTFTPQGRGDKVGASIEKIIGRFDGQEAGADQVSQMAYGSPAEPGGTPAAQLAQRIKSIFGENSKEWAAYKQGLLSHLVDNPDGTPRAAADAAMRIDKFLKAPKGKILSQVALTSDDRAALANHAETLRASTPVAFKDLDSPNKIIGRITGRDGGPLPSLNEVTDLLMGPGDKATLISTLKRTLSKDGFNALRVGMWNKTIGVTEGKTDLSPKRLSDNIFELLNGSRSATAQALYSSAERTEMLRLAQAIKMHIPLPGTTNPSGTAPMLTKIAGKAAEGILPLAGLMHGGIPGAIVGAVANKGVTAARNASAARRIGSLYYGEQPKIPVDPRFARAAAIAARGVQQGQVGSGP